MKNPCKNALKKWVMGAAIVSSVFTMYSCSTDITEELTQQSASSSSDATAFSGNNGDIIPGKYIVVLKEGEARQRINARTSYGEATRQARAYGQEILRVNGIGNAVIEHAYGSTIAGFSAALSEREVAKLGTDSRVAYTEPDRVITLSQKGKPGSGNTVPEDEQPYGIKRVGGAVDVGNNFAKRAWVIDTGIDLTHPDLVTSDNRHKSFISSGPESNDPNDYNGHGSHVAGTIAAILDNKGVAGVAAGTPVVAVKVLNRNGSGTTSGVIAGVDYVGANANNGDVANMSLGGGASKPLDDAVIAASQGTIDNPRMILFAIAAGNDGKYAGNYPPARAEGTYIFTISAYNSTYSAPSWSNFGNPPVDYSAPGVSIKSTWKSGGYNTISGTSMAAPHMAGILLLKGEEFLEKNEGFENLFINGYVIGDDGGANYGPVAVHEINELNKRE